MLRKIILFCLAVVASTEEQATFQSQYHAQDALGQYSYGYTGGPVTKYETKTADSITRGSYSYIDANGQVQTAYYVADPIYGFRVVATNLPEPHPEIKAAEAAKLKDAKLASLKPLVYLPQVTWPFLPQYGYPLALPLIPSVKSPPTAPLVNYVVLSQLQDQQQKTDLLKLSPTVQQIGAPQFGAPQFGVLQNGAAGIGTGTPQLKNWELKHEEHKDRAKRSLIYTPLIHTLLPAASQYEFKDAAGQYAYGYTGPTSSKTEFRSLGGATNGAYSYLDANGIVQSVSYTADGNGFKAVGTNF